MFIHLFFSRIRFVYECIDLVVHSFIHLSIHPSIHTLIHSFIHAIIRFIHLFHSFISRHLISFIHSFTCFLFALVAFACTLLLMRVCACVCVCVCACTRVFFATCGESSHAMCSAAPLNTHANACSIAPQGGLRSIAV